MTQWVSPESRSNYEVTEMFHSIQGEGMRAGELTTFIRFAVCNFDCEWCDTAHSLYTRKAFKFESMSAEKILDFIDEVENPAVCLTGGEPMYRPDYELVPIVKQLNERKKFVTIETNGSIVKDILYDDDSKVDLWSLSPKLMSAKTVHWSEHTEEVTKYCERWDGENLQFKLVVGSEEDIVDCMSFLKEFYLADAGIPVFIMPVFQKWKGKDVIRNWDIAQHPNVRIITQQHKYLGVR
tara:strand:+ start:314 stop:1027 length:714 start_codon:yes stop_codon:yes gene_type:complete